MPGGVRSEYRPPEEVFKTDSLKSFAHLAITRNHPTNADGTRLVSPGNRRSVSIGHVGENVREDGGNMVADLFVHDESAITEILGGGMKSISCGYRVDYDPTPGTTPDGQRYDGVQRNMVGNHVALLPSGTPPRGGEQCVLRLDSEGNEIDPRLNYGVDLEALKAQIEALKGELEKSRTDAADVSKLRADLASAQARVTELEAQVAPERLDALVADREVVVALAKANGVESKGLSSLAIKRAIVAKRTPANAARVDSLDHNALDSILAVYSDQPHPSMASVVAPLVPAPRTDAAPAPSVMVGTAPRTDAVDVSKLPKVAEMQANFNKASRDAWKSSTGDNPSRKVEVR